MIGKTVARIEEDPTDPEYGHADEGVVLVHFTDGTALIVSGHSHEEVSQSVGLLDPRSVRRWTAAAVGRREAERLRRLQRQEHLAVSCEERARRREIRRAESPNWMLGEVVEGWLVTDLLRSRMPGDKERTIRLPCEACGERQCPNAPTEVLPAFSWSHYGLGG